MYICFAITTFNKMFTVWDEYTHWSLVSKNMYYLNDFGTNINSTIDFHYPARLYPPSPTILQYFFCKVIGTYRQGIEVFAMQMLGFSLLISLFKNISNKRNIGILSILFVIIAIPAIFCESYFYITIYVDALLGLLVGYIFLEYFTSEKDMFFWIKIITCGLILAMTKPTGIIILLIIISALILYEIIEKGYNSYKNKDNIKIFLKKIIINKIILMLILSFVVGLTSWISWEIYTSKQFEKRNIIKPEIIETTYDGNMIKYIVKVFVKSTFIGMDENDTKNITSDMTSIKNLPTHLFDEAQFGNLPIKMSFTSWMVVYVLVSISIYSFLIKEKENKKKFIIFSIILLISTAMYILFIQVAYMTQFNNSEGILHSSLWRYVGTFLIAIFMSIIGCGFHHLNSSNDYYKKAYVIIAVITLLFTPIQPIVNQTIHFVMYNEEKHSLLEGVEEISNKISNKIDKDAKIYPVHQTANKDSDVLRFKYFMTPIYVASAQMFPENKENTSLGAKDLNEWKSILYNDFDYVMVLNSDKYFDENYNSIFENQEIKNWTLYKINKDNGIDQMILKEIEL